MVELSEHAHRRADQATQYVDDSDGWLSTISERLGDLHHRGCVLDPPDQLELAGRLVDFELTSELDGFHRAAQHWGDVLGEAGLAEFRRLVEPRWLALDHDAGEWSSERFAIEQAMVGLAFGMGDPDRLIDLSADVPMRRRAVDEIVELLIAAGRRGEAIDWARRGLEAVADRPWQGAGLRVVLGDLLRDRGDPDAALQVHWEAFVRSPSLSGYRRVVVEAGDQSDEVGARAVAWLRDQVGPARGGEVEVGRRSPSGGRQDPAQVLVEVLAHEGEVDAAWEVASAHGFDARTWMTLARAREADHPLESAEVYEREALAGIEHPSNHHYRTEVELLDRIRRLADDAGQPDRFTALLDRVRTEHARRTNLRRRLDDRGW